MNAVTLDLIATILASAVVLSAGGLAVWVLPWSDADWQPRRAAPEPAERARLPMAARELAQGVVPQTTTA